MGAIKKIANVVKKIDPLRGGDVLLEKAGLPTLTGEGDKNILDMGQAEAQRQADEARKAQEAAAAEQARIAQQAADNQAKLAEINKNFAANSSADLTGENRTNIQAGGSAAALDAANNDTLKKKGVGLASTLGINV